MHSLVIGILLYGGLAGNVLGFHHENVNDTWIGIDLGTTYSRVSVFRNGQIEVVANVQGHRMIPSYVAWNSDGERLIGAAAIDEAEINPDLVVFNFKRFIGRNFAEKTVQCDTNAFSFQLVNQENKPYVSITTKRIAERKYSPEEITSMIVNKMKETVEWYLGKEIGHAVISVPANFNYAQRLATFQAGVTSGLKVRLLSDASAAAAAVSIGQGGKEKNILVYDLGGGTFDATVIATGEGILEVLSTSGDTHLGGEDFNERVMLYFMKMMEDKYNLSIYYDKNALQRLRKAVEQAKRALSTRLQVHLEIESLYKNADFSETLTRAKFEELNSDLFAKTIGHVEKVIEDAGLSKSDIDEIVLVGGSSRIPKVQQLLQQCFQGKKPLKGINPDEAVVQGVALLGATFSGEYSETIKDLLAIEIYPFSIGIEAFDGVMTKIITRNTVIPAQRSRIISTDADNQSSLLIHVYEGEHPIAKQNKFVGKLELTSIPPAQRGVPKIEVRITISADSVLQIHASVKGTKNAETLIVNANSHLQESIERMAEESNSFSKTDKAAKKTSFIQTQEKVGLHSKLKKLKKMFFKGKTEV